MTKHILNLTICLTFLFLLGLPGQCWALQPHGEPEGHYVHQMAHILFLASLAYLYLHTRRTTALTGRGWDYLRIFCLFMFLWNLVAFTGHAVAVHISPEDFVDVHSWRSHIAPPINVVKMVYLITGMDHFLNVPALFALFLSLRTFYLEARKEEER